MFKSLIFILLFNVLAKAAIIPDSLKPKVGSLPKTQKLKSVSQSLKLTFGIIPYSQKQLPKVATLRSLILPGWGQITNKHYYKLPFIYGAAGTGIYFINRNSKKCDEYVGYLEKLESEKIEETFIKGRGPYSKTLINNAARTYRRWKQGTIIGFGLGWLLFAVDANVSAHLKTFDVSDDISFKLKPSIIQLQGRNAAGISLNLQVK